MSPYSTLATPSATRAVLDAYGLSTKKSLGQHFLVNDVIVGKILDLADIQPGDCVVEVGPGIGTLTCALLAAGARVVAIERDPELPAVLEETCAEWADQLTVLQMDALDLQAEDLARAFDGAGAGSPSSSGHAWGSEPLAQTCAKGAAPAIQETAPLAQGTGLLVQEHDKETAPLAQAQRSIKFVANLPYAVAATLVLDYFERFEFLESATVMVQAEVADRMMAQTGTKDYGAYTVKLALLAKPAGRFKVGPGNFFPPPRVDSAVIRLDRVEGTPLFPNVPVGEKAFASVRAVSENELATLTPEERHAAATMADAAFANRRKTLANSCKTYFSDRPKVLEALPSIFEQTGIDPTVRGETLALEGFISLGKFLATL